MHLNKGIALDCIAMHRRAFKGMHEPPCQANAISTDGIANLLSRQMSNEGFTDFFIGKHAGKAKKSPTKNVAEILMTTK